MSHGPKHAVEDRAGGGALGIERMADDGLSMSHRDQVDETAPLMPLGSRLGCGLGPMDETPADLEPSEVGLVSYCP